MGKRILIEEGDKYGELTIVCEMEPVSSTRERGWSRNQRMVLASCSCGSGEKKYRLCALRSGHTISCGCVNKNSTTTHGMSKTREHQAWASMFNRCINPSHASYKHYKNYEIDEAFKSFEVFYAEIGPKPKGKYSLDRKNNSKGYVRGNIKWSTRPEQDKNTSRSRWWFVNGKKFPTAREASEHFGVSQRKIGEWCGVYTKNGKFNKKANCWSELKYL